MRNQLDRAFRASWLLLLGACARGPAPLPRLVPAKAEIPGQAPLPSVWRRTTGATRIGPALPGGTWVLLGGRRALLQADGSLIEERVATPEPLLDLALVPTLRGDKLFGYGPYTVYRFDDPLGAPRAFVGTRDNVQIDHIGAGPGVLIVWGLFFGRHKDEAPLVIDAVKGTKRKLVGWPEAPLHDIAFRTMDEGAVLFEGLGLALTRDGGTTFFAPQAEKPEEAQLFDRLGRWGEGFVVRRGWFSAPLDLATGAVSALSLEPRAMPPLLEWIALTSADPLRLAVTEGSMARDGRMLIGVEGVAARVDPRTGAVFEVAHWGDAEDVLNRNPAKEPTYNPRAPYPKPACLSAVLPEEGLLLCLSLGAQRVSREGPLDPKPFSNFRPTPYTYRVNGYQLRDFVYRPGGGFASLSACSPREGGEGGEGSEEGWASDRLCTLQERAKLETIKAPVKFRLLAETNNLGALADGRVVYIDEDPRDSSVGDPLPEPFFVVFDARGVVRKLPPFELPDARFRVSVMGAIEEGADGALYALVSAGGLYAVRQPWNGPATALRLPSASFGELRRGRGVALGDYEMLISSDAGANWVSVGPFPPFPETYEPHRLVVGEAGAQVGGWLRVGWEAGAPFALPPGVKAAPIVLPSHPPRARWSR